MENRLVSKSCETQIEGTTFRTEFVAPRWARSYECTQGTCGLCCLAELPQKVPRKHNSDLDQTICGLYNIQRRSCLKYSERPFGCRIYPFFMGVEEGIILTSTMLGCPGTNCKSETDPRILTETLGDSSVAPIVLQLHNIYERAKNEYSLWLDAAQIWRNLSNVAGDFLTQRTHFPFASDFKDLMLNMVDDLLEIPKSERRHYAIPSIATLLPRTVRSYIATRFSSTKLYFVKVRGSKAVIISLGKEKGEVERTKIKTPLKPLSLEIERDARNILEDYFMLLLKRPFLSLATQSLFFFATAVPTLLSDILVGSIVNLEVGATFIASRDSLKSIDKDSMREIISLSDALTLGLFRRPDKSVWRS